MDGTRLGLVWWLCGIDPGDVPSLAGSMRRLSVGLWVLLEGARWASLLRPPRLHLPLPGHPALSCPQHPGATWKQGRVASHDASPWKPLSPLSGPLTVPPGISWVGPLSVLLSQGAPHSPCPGEAPGVLLGHAHVHQLTGPRHFHTVVSWLATRRGGVTWRMQVTGREARAAVLGPGWRCPGRGDPAPKTTFCFTLASGTARDSR